MTATDATRGSSRLFAYGTLMFPQVFRAVCELTRPSVSASLRGYVRYGVRDHAFPGIVPDAGSRVDGCLINDIDEFLWQRLDEFESDFYARVTVPVLCVDGLELSAQTYVVAPAWRHVLDGAQWSAQDFQAGELDAYLARYT